MPNTKTAPPTDDEIEFVAKVMDYDKVLDWSRPERCENAKALAKQIILGYRACTRLGETAKKAEPAKVEPVRAAVAKAEPSKTAAKG